jgi:hypothetical protein
MIHGAVKMSKLERSTELTQPNYRVDRIIRSICLLQALHTASVGRRYLVGLVVRRYTVFAARSGVLYRVGLYDQPGTHRSYTIPLIVALAAAYAERSVQRSTERVKQRWGHRCLNRRTGRYGYDIISYLPGSDGGLDRGGYLPRRMLL